MIMSEKELLGTLAVVISIVAFIPYIKSIIAGNTRPHLFSWIIWGIITSIIFFAQISEGGGSGAWATGVSAIFTLLIAFLAYRYKSDVSITKTDWCFFITALCTIPLWLFLHNPLLSVVILLMIDCLGFIPTLTKTYRKPYQEHLLIFYLGILGDITSMLALQSYSLTTILFPIITLLQCVVLISTASIRRYMLNSR